MRILFLHDEKIKSSELEKLQKEFTELMRKNAGIKPEYRAQRENYTTYPTYIDSDGDVRPTNAYLKSVADRTYKNVRDTVDHIVVLIHEDNWRSSGPLFDDIRKAAGLPVKKGIWGTNYSFAFRNYQLHYCRWDRDNQANALGTLWHEISHSFDAFIKTYANFDIRTLFPGMTSWDAGMTHGGCCGFSYIGRRTGRENLDALQKIAPYLRQSYEQRHRLADKEYDAIVEVMKKIAVLYRSLLNKKHGVTL